MSTLTLLRHGQASFGSAHYDALSPLGIQQAQACGAYFVERGLRFDTVYTGPRQRQQDTARLALEACQAPPARIEMALDEFGEGSQILRAAEARTGIAVFSDPELTKGQRLRLYAEQIRLWANADVTIDGIVAAGTFRAGVREWLDQLCAASGSGRHVLAVSSAGVIAAIVCELLALPDAAMSQIMRVIDNASLTTIVWSAQDRSLKSFNQTAHLPPTLLSDI